MRRRSFLVGAVGGMATLVLTACTTDDPQPAPTSSTPLPTPTGTEVPAPAALARSDWANDSFSRGGTSRLGAGASPALRAALAAPLVERVFFAGEATSVEHANTVDGAWTSGEDAADAVAGVAGDGERVIVIGAGASGAAATASLVRRGFVVQVLEARDRTGGRMRSVVDDAWPIAPQLGAWSVRADGPLAERLRDADVETETLGRDPVAGVVPVVDPGAGAAPTDAPDDTEPTLELQRTPDGADVDVIARGAELVADAVRRAGEAVADVALEVAIADLALGEEDAAAVEAYLASRVVPVTGADAAELSAWYLASQLPVGERELVTGDLQAVLDRALEGAEVALSAAVVGVAVAEEAVSVRLGTGESITADRVVVTVPLGVLQQSGVEFTPGLPFAQRAAVAGLGVGQSESIWLRYDEAWWATDAVRWTVVDPDALVHTWINLEPLTGEPVLVAFVGGDAATEAVALDEAALLERLLGELEPFLDAPAAE